MRGGHPWVASERSTKWGGAVMGLLQSGPQEGGGRLMVPASRSKRRRVGQKLFESYLKVILKRPTYSKVILQRATYLKPILERPTYLKVIFEGSHKIGFK